MRSFKFIRNIAVLYLLFTATVYASFSHHYYKPSTSKKYAVSVTEYDLGTKAFRPTLPSGLDLTDPPDIFSEFTAAVYHPAELNQGPFPIIFALHGGVRHICYTLDENEQPITVSRATWPCAEGQIPYPNYRGYDYFGELMASHGYIVVSISANGMGAVDRFIGNELRLGRAAYPERAELIQAHINYWVKLNNEGAEPFDKQFIGAVDLDNIGTMGHSRGGEAVVNHYHIYVENAEDPETAPKIKAVLTLAPTNFSQPGTPMQIPGLGSRSVENPESRLTLHETALLNLHGICDGQTSGLASVRYFDESQYAKPGDKGALHNIIFHGGNHNFFNRLWSPSDSFPGFGRDDNRCTSLDLPEQFRMLSQDEQENILDVYGSAFYRVYLGKERHLMSTLTGDKTPGDLLVDKVVIQPSYSAPDVPGFRLEINRTENEERLYTNNLGAEVVTEGLVEYDICGKTPGSGLFPCMNVGRSIFSRVPVTSVLSIEDFLTTEYYTFNYRRTPHRHTNNFSTVLYSRDSDIGVAFVRLAWETSENETPAYYENKLPSEYSNISAYQTLKFRVSVDFDELKRKFNPDRTLPDFNLLETRNPIGEFQDFSIVLTDIYGRSDKVQVSDFSNALYFPPGNDSSSFGPGAFPKQLLSDVRIPIKAFKRVNKRKISSIKFVFDKTPQGSVLVTDLGLSGAEVCAAGLPEAITNEEGRRFIRGTKGDDVIVATQRFNIINAVFGNDCVVTGDGKSIVYANKNTRVIRGSGKTRVIRFPDYY